MSTFVDAEARVLAFETSPGSTAAFTQGDTNRYVFGGVSGADFGGAPTISAFKVGGSGGTNLVAALSDLIFYGSAARMRVGGLAGGPTGTSDIYGAVSGGIQMTVAGAAYDGVDQITPINDPDENEGLEGGVTVATASITIDNVPSGERVVAVLVCASESFSIDPFVALGTANIRAQAQGGSGEELFGVCVVDQERTGGTTGSVTIQIECHSASAGALAWGMQGGWLLSVSGGAVDHPSTGALAAQAATVAGTAARTRLHPTTGALVVQAATISGSATRSAGPVSHPTTGALVAQAATVAGAALRTRLHPTTGALTATAATVAGTALRTRPHPTTGALAAQAAVIAGSATNTPAAGPHASSGALIAQSAQVAGAAVVVSSMTETRGGFYFDLWAQKHKKKATPPPQSIEEAVEFIQEEVRAAETAPKSRQIPKKYIPSNTPQQIAIAERMLRMLHERDNDDEELMLLF